MTNLDGIAELAADQVVIPPEQIAAKVRAQAKQWRVVSERLLALAKQAVVTPSSDAPVALAVLADAMLEANRLSVHTQDPIAAAWRWAREETWSSDPTARVSSLATHMMLGMVERTEIPADYAHYVDQERAQRMFGSWPERWELAERCRYHVFALRPDRRSTVQFLPADARSHRWLEENAAHDVVVLTIEAALRSGDFRIHAAAAELQRRLRAEYPRASLLVRARGAR